MKLEKPEINHQDTGFFRTQKRFSENTAILQNILQLNNFRHDRNHTQITGENNFIRVWIQIILT